MDSDHLFEVGRMWDLKTPFFSNKVAITSSRQHNMNKISWQ